MLIMPLGDIFIDLFDLTARQYSYLVSSYSFGAMLSSVFAFLYMDRFDRKTALIVLYAGFVIGTFLCGLSEGYYMLMTLRFITGMFGGVIGALAFAIVADLYKFKERGRAMGILMGAFSAASALGVPFGLYLAAQHSWRTPFLSLGGIGLIVLAFVILKFPSIRHHLHVSDVAPSIRRTFNLLLGDKNQLNALLLGSILVLGHFIIIPFISPYMIRNVGFSQMDITYIFLLGGLSMIISSPLVGRMTDRYGVMRLFTICIFLSMIPTVAITHMGPSPIWVGLIYTTLFFIFGSARMIPANTIITASVGVENRGSFMSMKSALQQMSIGLASIISGEIVILNQNGTYDNYHMVAYLSIIFLLVSIYLCSRLRVAEGN